MGEKIKCHQFWLKINFANVLGTKGGSRNKNPQFGNKKNIWPCIFWGQQLGSRIYLGIVLY